ncbi:RNA polymerase sigma factor [Aquisphaera insulae]|uniref:RNA polymerase sigma factor n=1 Tax=Aquisphaera insulae TaxID=2712864 RepID=UPI0013ECD5FD|nr:sigma-70 family RNA polymerase sigma factor [Aquisphaera insulae]
MRVPSGSQSPSGPLETLWTAGALGSLNDGELLDRFQARPDASGQEAFRLLVERHGPMVLGLCRGIVRDAHDAEDAFQATFLVLARRAASIRNRQTIGPWLCGVAGRVARKARVRSRRHRHLEIANLVDPTCPPDADAESSAAESTILEEIAQLPESLRAPLVLCGLQGLSYDQAASTLGVREPTLRGRLHRARRQLAARLRRRGLLAPTLGAIRLHFSLPSGSLVEGTTQLASRWPSVAGLLVGVEAIPEPIAALVQGVTQAMTMQTIRISAVGLALLLGASALTTVVVARQDKTATTGEAALPSPVTNPAKPPSAAFLRRKNQEILQKLEEPIALAFPEPTPLEVVLVSIKRATATPTFPGIPITASPYGLQEAGHTLQSPVQIERAGLPLKLVLHQALRPLGLSYFVKDGYLTIDSRIAVTEPHVEELDGKLDRILEALGRLEKPSGH